MNKNHVTFQVSTDQETVSNFENYYKVVNLTGKKTTKSAVLKTIFDYFFKNPQNLAIANAGKSMDERLKEILSGKKTDAGEPEKEINLW